MGLRLNTVVRLTDGRIGTICWHYLDGDGGVWGVHTFEMPEGGFGDNIPAPEFMLREKKVEPLLRAMRHRPDVECVGEDYEVIEGAAAHGEEGMNRDL